MERSRGNLTEAMLKTDSLEKKRAVCSFQIGKIHLILTHPPGNKY
jgi:hypothetical protein